MNTIKYITSGSQSGFHANMMIACLIKFGENPNKETSKKMVWNPTADSYANVLLNKFVGGIGPRNAPRVFLRSLLANELGNYYLTGKKTEGLVESINKLDRAYWCAGQASKLLACI